MDGLKQWMIAATAQEIRALARFAGTSTAQLHHIATGRRNASAEMAGKIEDAAGLLTREGLPSLNRGDVCPACTKCRHLMLSVGGGQ